jgi:beta-phosphoglucomutase
MSSSIGAIFDLDGTLVDSQRAHYLSFRDAFKEIGLEFDTEDFRLLFGKLSKNIAGDYLLSRGYSWNESQLASFAEKKQEIFRKKYAVEVRAYPGVIETLEAIKAQGYGMSLASNSPKKNVEAMLSSSGLKKVIKFIVCVDEVENPKPHPEMLLKAADNMGLHPSNLAAVDDSLHGISAAKKAGMSAIAVLTGGAKEAELLALRPDMILESVSDLKPEIIKSLVGIQAY